MKRILTALLALLFLIHAQNVPLKASDAGAGNIITVYEAAAAAPTLPAGWTFQWNKRSQLGDSRAYALLSYDEKAKAPPDQHQTRHAGRWEHQPSSDARQTPRRRHRLHAVDGGDQPHTREAAE